MAEKSPMLAERRSAHLFPKKVRFPLYGLPKFDGIRCVVSRGLAVSRSFIGIKNNHVRESLSIPELEGLDGELTVGPPAAETVYNRTTAVNGNKSKTPPDFTWHVFDDFTNPDAPYEERQLRAAERVFDLGLPFIRSVPAVKAATWEELEAYEQATLDEGYEGVITRSAEGVYKFGRSTAKEQGMLKLKRFTDAEAEVIGFEELMHNTNENIKDAFGRAKRSKAQDGLVPGNTLGRMRVRDLKTGVEFQIGMFKGLTLADKQEIWDNRDAYMGKLVKYSHFAHGAIDKPRHSKFLGWRDADDL